MRTITEALRQEAGANLRVTGISPGFVQTELADKMKDPAVRAAIKDKAALIAISPDAIAEAVHPDLIRNYQLGKTIQQYGFFSYAVSESLFMSDKEKFVIAGLFEGIANELENSIDHFSQDILVSQIELLLNYSNRFYNRQFITRKAVYNDLIGKLDAYLSDRLDSGKSSLTGLPSVQEVSDHLKVSPRYLTDMLKSLTGKSTQQHIHDRLIENAAPVN